MMVTSSLLPHAHLHRGMNKAKVQAMTEIFLLLFVLEHVGSAK